MSTDGTPARFRFATGDHVVSGPVRGLGGLISGSDALDRILVQQRRAAAGRALTIYEPRPGHVRVYPDYSAAGDGEPVDVELRIASVAMAPAASG